MSQQAHNRAGRNLGCGTLKWAALFMILAAVSASIMPTPKSSVSALQWGEWSNAVNASQTNTPSGGGSVVGDQFGNIYVVWPEITSSGVQPAQPYDTAFIRCMGEGGEWSEPVDIFAVPYGERLDLSASRIDAYGDLVLLWGDGRTLYLSSAAPTDALSARGWQTVSLVQGSIQGGNIQFDSQGGYHVVYVEDNSAIRYMASRDGNSWERPILIGQIVEENTAFSGAGLVLGPDDSVYVTWTEHAGENNWRPSGVWFSKYDADDHAWLPPIRLVERDGDGQSSILVDSNNIVRVAWSRAAGTHDGRYHTWSTDGGLTWTEPQHIVPFMDGLCGAPSMAEDSAGNLFVVFCGGDPSLTAQGIRSGIWLARWDGTHWSTPELVSPNNLVDSEGSGATMIAGSILVVTWHEVVVNEAWFRMLNTGAPKIAPILLPRPTPKTAQLSSPTIQPEPSPTRVHPTPVLLNRDISQIPASPGSDVLASLVPSPVLVMGVIIVAVWRRSSS